MITTNRNKLIGYIKLLFFIILILGFVHYLAPVFDNLSFVKPIVELIDENEINATALYYTEINEFSIAELNIINSFNYSPLDSPKVSIVKETIE